MLLRPTAGGVRVAVKVVTRSAKNRVARARGDRLKVCVTAPPEKGRANELVVETLAEFFGVRRGNVRIAAGGTSSLKEVEIGGIDETAARNRLEGITA